MRNDIIVNEINEEDLKEVKKEAVQQIKKHWRTALFSLPELIVLYFFEVTQRTFSLERFQLSIVKLEALRYSALFTFLKLQLPIGLNWKRSLHEKQIKRLTEKELPQFAKTMMQSLPFLPLVGFAYVCFSKDILHGTEYILFYVFITSFLRLILEDGDFYVHLYQWLLVNKFEQRFGKEFEGEGLEVLKKDAERAVLSCQRINGKALAKIDSFVRKVFLKTSIFFVLIPASVSVFGIVKNDVLVFVSLFGSLIPYFFVSLLMPLVLYALLFNRIFDTGFKVKQTQEDKEVDIVAELAR